jgi:hypothetical protein
LGGGFEKALGDVFGFGGKPGNNIGFADLGTGETGGYGTYNPENERAAIEIAALLKPLEELFGAEIGGRLEVSDRGWVRLQGEKYTEVDELISDVITKLVEKSKTLTAPVKALVKAFDGTTDELVTFASSLMSISELIANNPVDAAVKDFADSQEAAGRRITDVYNDQVQSILDMTFSFDGSAEAAATLNNALVVNKQLAYDMATALQAIGESTKTLVQDEIDYFEKSVRTPDEQLQFLEKQAVFLDALLPTLTDPDQIIAARDKALEVNRAIFDAGPEDLQRLNVGVFTEGATRIGEQADEALANATEKLQISQEDLNTQIAGMLTIAASEFQGPADTMYSAAELMYLAVQNFINNGVVYGEVVA